MGALRVFKKFNTFLIWLALGLLISGGILFLSANAYAQNTPAKASGESTGWGLVAAALAVGFSSLGAGIAVSGVGSAAMGAVSERPELMGRSLIYVGIAEGIAIYGLIVSIMILGRI